MKMKIIKYPKREFSFPDKMEQHSSFNNYFNFEKNEQFNRRTEPYNPGSLHLMVGEDCDP